MPVGPSHGRGRSSSSFRSSSSSRRSSSSSYRSSSSRSYGGHRHYHGHSHTTYYGSGIEINMSPRGWAIFGLIWGFLFVLIFGIIGMNKISTNLPYRRLMRRDATEYLEIIEKANAGEDGYYKIHIENISNSSASTVGGNPTEYGLSTPTYDFYARAYTEVMRDGVYYYYLDLTFEDGEGREISGTTYSYYSEAAVIGMSSIDLVYTKEYDGDGSWDIIQANYSLDKNLDYWYTGNQVTTGVIFVVVALGFGALFVWCSTLVHKARMKAKESSGTDSTTNATENTTTSTTTKYKYCKYCGTQNPYESSRCNACGSREFKE